MPYCQVHRCVTFYSRVHSKNPPVGWIRYVRPWPSVSTATDGIYCYRDPRFLVFRNFISLHNKEGPMNIKPIVAFSHNRYISHQHLSSVISTGRLTTLHRTASILHQLIGRVRMPSIIGQATFKMNYQILNMTSISRSFKLKWFVN